MIVRCFQTFYICLPLLAYISCFLFCFLHTKSILLTKWTLVWLNKCEHIQTTLLLSTFVFTILVEDDSYLPSFTSFILCHSGSAISKNSFWLTNICELLLFFPYFEMLKNILKHQVKCCSFLASPPCIFSLVLPVKMYCRPI